MINRSGINPVEYKVLILPDTVEEVTAAGLYLTPATRDREQLSQTYATFVVAGAMAFTDPDWPAPPQPGDRVLFSQYAGGVVKGADGKKYRICNDKDITAILDEERKDGDANKQGNVETMETP